MDWSNLSLNDMSTLYFVGIIVVLLAGYLLQKLIPGIAGKVIAFCIFIIFCAAANWAIQTDMGKNPYPLTDPALHESSNTSSSGVSDSTPASVTPERDYNAPVPASGSGE